MSPLDCDNYDYHRDRCSRTGRMCTVGDSCAVEAFDQKKKSVPEDADLINQFDYSTEKWKTIHNFEMYQISNMGRIRTRKGHKLLKPYWTHYQYMQVDLYRIGKKHHKKVHRLVAEAFCWDFWKECAVHHINGDNQDNRAENLECMPPEAHYRLKKNREENNE